ncbi:GNAT family N-acetyltransferase [Chamaesiphon sp. VAR_48_metabat_403]|uniref:GNAT family N-acetyltransferase n=1 Tax=Chamaesiphon sp. VAR_48_metabat_403 TaxID=2964700 RepID=UPI00286E7765|nr:GNAT family N-acetyltransferase [Chamaesiphon sp. VAR_48_metabat_403]
MNQPNLTFRRANPDDLDFVSYCNYTASSPSPGFCYWDSLIEDFGIETMAFIRQAIALDVLAWCRISDFIIAENNGIPVAGASCFVMSQDDYRPIDLKNIRKLYSLLEWRSDRIKQFEEKYQNVWYNPKDETLKASGNWTVECVVVVEQFRGQGISKNLMNYIIKEARAAEIESIGISVTIGNEIAERLYLSVGFQKYITFFSEYYFNQFPGTAKFRLRLFD